MGRSKDIKRIWLLRHAESRGNTGHESDIDPPLSPLGEQQAAKLQKALGHISFDKIYLSPLKRTRQTLEISGLDMKNIVFDSRIIEYRYEGAYNTILPYEAVPEYGLPDTRDAWLLPYQDRIRDFASEIAGTDFKDILIVTHGGSSIALTCAFLENSQKKLKDPESMIYYLKNTGIAQLRLSPDGQECRLGIWNHTAHLGQIPEIMQESV